MRIEPCLGALLSWKRKRVAREGASFSFDFFLSLSFSHNAHDFSASASLSPLTQTALAQWVRSISYARRCPSLSSSVSMAQATTSDANALLGLEKCLKGNRTITSRRRRRSPFARRLSSEMLLLGLSLELDAGRKSVRPACSTPQRMYPQSKREEAFDLRRRASSASLPPAAAASRALRFPPFRRSLPGSHSDPLRFVARRTRNVRRRRAEDESRRGVTSWAKHPPPRIDLCQGHRRLESDHTFFPFFLSLSLFSSLSTSSHLFSFDRQSPRLARPCR